VVFDAQSGPLPPLGHRQVGCTLHGGCCAVVLCLWHTVYTLVHVLNAEEEQQVTEAEVKGEQLCLFSAAAAAAAAAAAWKTGTAPG